MTPQPSLRVLALGMGWFPEQSGGLNRMVYHLAQALPAAGVDLHTLVAGGVAEAGVSGFAPLDAPLAQRLRGARAVAAARPRPDVVASHFALYAAPALGPLRGVPHVVHFHGPWAAEGAAEGEPRWATATKRAVERHVYRRADRFIVLSEAFRDVLVGRYGADPACVRIVPGGVEAGRFDTGLSRADTRARLGWDADRPTVLAVRRLARRMGLEDLIDATAALRASVPDVLVQIAGTGAIEGELRARVAARGLGGHVRLLGFVPDADLPLAYRAANISVVPTVALEGFGLIAAESLAAGTPALVTPVGGLPEVVRGLSPALVLPDTGPDAVADGLARALTGRLALPDAAACQAFARGRYDWSVIARGVADVYAEVAR